TPGEPTDPDDPNDTPRYGPEDSVYVKIINNDTQAEGADLSHTVQLVDANGDPVTVAAGETITITLTYQGSGTDAAEIDDYVATTTVTIVGGTSETTFTNEALDDFFAENDEEYTVTIDTATQAQDTYENVALHTIANGAPSDAISVTGTITDNPAQDTENPGTPGEPTDPDDPNDTPRYGPEDSVYVKIINNDTQAEGADLSHTVQLVDANGDPV
ncbi:hypothetical protein, partial [Vibrio parahaemolyticus]|uniref:hypothetical protein n=1 Tax=Vibrio parahaemolyticus TaxID=670 RepID=UPI003AAF9894